MHIDVAVSRSSAGTVGTRGSRQVSKSASRSTSADASVQSVPSVTRLEIAAPSSTARAAQVRSLVSRIQAPSGSATRNDDQYGSSSCSAHRPPCPWRSSSAVITSTASSALRARSSPSRTRSMPVSAGGALRGSSIVKIRSFPIATRCSLHPCSKPHIHVGREPTRAYAPVSSRSRCVVRSEPWPSRAGYVSTTWTSSRGRSEFFPKSVPVGPTEHRVSHMSPHLGALLDPEPGRERPADVRRAPRPDGWA